MVSVDFVVPNELANPGIPVTQYHDFHLQLFAGVDILLHKCVERIFLIQITIILVFGPTIPKANAQRPFPSFDVNPNALRFSIAVNQCDIFIEMVALIDECASNEGKIIVTTDASS